MTVSNEYFTVLNFVILFRYKFKKQRYYKKIQMIFILV
jgi:hypothetical protein